MILCRPIGWTAPYLERWTDFKWPDAPTIYFEFGQRLIWTLEWRVSNWELHQWQLRQSALSPDSLEVPGMGVLTIP